MKKLKKSSKFSNTHWPINYYKNEKNLKESLGWPKRCSNYTLNSMQNKQKIRQKKKKIIGK
jgi:hypothetical protein